MVLLNDRIKQYMEKCGQKNILLSIEKITSWCAPPLMEMAVMFTEKDEATMIEDGFVSDKSELGMVYYPKEGIRIVDQITVKYVDYPWISCFEVDGIEIIKKKCEKDEKVPDFPFENFDDILYSSDNESENKSGGNENVSDIEQSFGICGSE